jgi:hypothetical protein
MYDLGYDLVVEDAEFTDLADALERMAGELEAKLGDYQRSLDRVVAAAIQEGLVAENLGLFADRATALAGEASDLAAGARRVLEGFVGEIDRADKELY